MNLFTKSCACGGFIFGPRLGGKARGEWLGYDQCRDCRDASADTHAKRGDVEQAPSPMGSAVLTGETPDE